MDYEKKYKNALEKAKSMIDDLRKSEDILAVSDLESMFPELKESGDERIRRAIIELVKFYYGSSLALKHTVSKDDMLAWLKKQGEQKISVVDFKAKDWYVSKVDGKIYNAKFMKKPPTNQARRLEIEKAAVSATGIIDQEEWFIKGAEWADKNPSYISSEKQCEPKILGVGVEHASGVLKECIDKMAPKSAMETINEEKVDNQNCVKVVDKAEPKFKVGNWYQCTKDFFGKGVTFDKNTAYYCAQEGCLQCEYGCHIAIVKGLYDNFKLWTIQDAKDGDVLADEGKPFIFKDFDRFHPGCPVAYCGINDEDYFIVSSGDGWWTGNEKVLPATKEQYDLLFAKMKDAGYTFDFETKELNKIEEEPHVIDEGKAEMDHCFTKMMNGEKVNPAWSEEDERIISKILAICEDFKRSFNISPASSKIVQKDIDKISNWLKSLKERLK